MNIFIGTGMASNARLVNNGQILRFVLVTEGNEKSRNEIPCIIFNPSADVKSLLSKGLFVELSGKVRSFVIDFAGEKTVITEIVVNPRSIQAVKS
jgi:hypothetical protein